MRRFLLALCLVACWCGESYAGEIAAAKDDGHRIPAESFRHEGAWKFANFTTKQMDWDGFTKAFHLTWQDRINPVTYIFYFAARGMASTGNCCGMCHLAVQGATDGSAAAPYSGTLREKFWSTCSLNENLRKDINVWHWQQVSTCFLRKYLHAMFARPATTASRIEKDLLDKKYGMLSIRHGLDGHVLVPLKVVRQGHEILIHVYDPNRPCMTASDRSFGPPITIRGNSWSYPMNKTTWTEKDGQVVYVGYEPSDDWHSLPNNVDKLMEIILAGGGAKKNPRPGH